MAIGTLVKYNARKGWAILRPDDGEPELLVDMVDIYALAAEAGWDPVRARTRVHFELKIVDRGRRAYHLHCCEPA
ncbi:cold shock CspA family protein [Luteibacter sp. Sphag1AF]|uniref:hypothetical protein n=1 Tax=Luteibacter sp. Sphag1AF TaxID=2587031 RepID=UPI00160E7486|nr:hypothetical protein [Luteibacter sp. Sphag1AF]MBB3228572.1 cold shock CspA family protein [Luteibacter sp. Sphag1AF]